MVEESGWMFQWTDSIHDIYILFNETLKDRNRTSRGYLEFRIMEQITGVYRSISLAATGALETLGRDLTVVPAIHHR